MTPELMHLFIICAIIEMLVAIPGGVVLKRIGYSPWWALLCFIPILALLSLWLLAFTRWPRDGEERRGEAA
jgi:hypothetical protein